jgi:hypothetical protein
MSNYVIKRPEYVGYFTTASSYIYASGMSASAITDSNDLGSCREVTFELSSEVLKATSTNYNDAVVETLLSGYEGTLTILLEEITSSAMMLGYGLSGSAALWNITGSSSTPTNYAIVVEPFMIDGSANTAIFTKCNMTQPPTRKLSRDQELLELKFSVMVDVSASAVAFIAHHVKFILTTCTTR